MLRSSFPENVVEMKQTGHSISVIVSYFTFRISMVKVKWQLSWKHMRTQLVIRKVRIETIETNE